MYRVLVADDERWIRKGIVKMIDREALGIGEIYEADSVTAALEEFGLHEPDIILSDVMFPAENGCSFCEQVFSVKPETRIVMISAHDSFEFARRSIKFQAVDYLLKPVSKEQLNQVLRQCIEQIEKNRNADDIREKSALPAEEVPGEGEETSREQIKDMMKYIRNNPAERYTLADMAAECCLSEVYFSNLFKKVSGMSPTSFITSVRMEKAKERIASTDWKLVKIAQSVGYTDYQYFTKVFKKTTGQTPGEYKETLQKEYGDD